MADVGIHHQPELAHHVCQGVAWLSASGAGERLAARYWATLVDRKPEEHDLREIASFKRVAVDSSVNGSRISVEYLSQEIPVKTQERRGLRLGNWWRSLLPKNY